MRPAGLLVIRADANRTLGAGHVMRCLSLAHAWRERGGQVLFIGRYESDALARRVRVSGCELIELSRDTPDPARVAALVEDHLGARTWSEGDQRSWGVIDGAHFTEREYLALRGVLPRLACIDDFAHLEFYHVTVIVNPNLHAGSLAYRCADGTTLLLGARYVLLRPEFLAWRGGQPDVPVTASRMLVTLGGSPEPATIGRVLRALSLSGLDDLEVTVLGGFQDSTASMICDRELPLRRVFMAAPDADVPGLMAWAHLAILCAGGTLWEALYMGCPTMSFSRNETQDIVLNLLEERGAVEPLGSIDNLCEEQVADRVREWAVSRAVRLQASLAGRDVVDGAGAARIVAQLLE